MPRPVPELKTRNVVTLTSLLLTRTRGGVDEALRLASYVHDGAERKEVRASATYRDPYVIHPIRCALRTMRLVPSAPEHLLETTLLHDVVEDGPERVLAFYDVEPFPDVGPTEIRDLALGILAERFGEDAAETVRRVSNPLPAPDSRPSRAEQAAAYLGHLRAEVLEHQWAAQVKVADLIDNAGSLHHMAGGDKRLRMAFKYAVPVAAVRGAMMVHGQPGVADRLGKVSVRLGQILDREPLPAVDAVHNPAGLDALARRVEQDQALRRAAADIRASSPGYAEQPDL